MSSKITFFLLFFLLTTPTLTFSHGGHKEKNNSTTKVEEPLALNDSIYAIGKGQGIEPTTITDDPLGFPLSNTDILGSENSAELELGGEPMIRFKELTNSQGKHDQHKKQKQHVEKATHEWVSPHSKGHGVAVGITVVSGLVFVALSFIRIGEGDAKYPS